jgi:hypothetical protein
MSVNNFIPEVCAAEFQETLDRNLVFAEDCNRDYEGEVKKVGDAVRILGLGDAQTSKWTDGKLHRVDVDYQIEDTSMLMPINQISYWRFGIDDLDKRQAQSGNSLYSRWMQKENKRVARDMDEHIAGIHVGDLGVEVYQPKISGSVVSVSVDGSNGTMPILTLMDEITQKLMENDVDPDAYRSLTAPWQFIMMLKRAYVELDTDNSEMLKNGKVGMFGSTVLKASNNCFKDASGFWHLQFKTKEAITFANPFTHTHAYTPEDYFEDKVKGYSLYQAKVVDGQQIIDCKFKMV